MCFHVPMTMDFTDHIRRDAAMLREVAGRDLGAAVPSCPGWTLADLLYHVGEVHELWAEIARRGETGQPTEAEYPDPPRPSDADLPQWAAGCTERLITAIDKLDPAQPLWNWSQAPKVGAFVARRMAHETAVHRVDGQLASGTPNPIDRELAVDGIDEYLKVFLASAGAYARAEEGAIRFAPSDHPHTWTAVLAAPGPTMHRDVGSPADLTVRGPASDVLLAMWLRDADVTFDGDESLWEAWREHVTGVNT